MISITNGVINQTSTRTTAKKAEGDVATHAGPRIPRPPSNQLISPISASKKKTFHANADTTGVIIIGIVSNARIRFFPLNGFWMSNASKNPKTIVARTERAVKNRVTERELRKRGSPNNSK